MDDFNSATTPHEHMEWSIYKHILHSSYEYALVSNDVYSLHQQVFDDSNFLKNVDSIEWVYERDIKELKRIILELSFSSFSCDFEIGSKVSSAGFSVEFYPGKYLKIDFGYVGSDEILYSIHVNNRKEKIKRLIA